ncbi:MAG: UDP-glucose--hexose-1-phosphate uridylyltransferase [Spirochaetia bacterium]
MNVDQCIVALVEFGLLHGWFGSKDRTLMCNRLLEVLQRDHFIVPTAQELPEICRSVEKISHVDVLLEPLVQDAIDRQVIEGTAARRDLFDTKLIGVLLPHTTQVNKQFWQDYKQDPHLATDRFYQFSQDTHYIRSTRIAKDRKWVYESCYGNLEITINLSKPEKDPRDIAALKDQQRNDYVYPACMLCPSNEGYAGRLDHPARQNLRLIELNLQHEEWYLQYSPYIYYQEHAIVLSGQHRPMVINEKTFACLFDFLKIFPHYFIGSNADLPIVGGSILNHDHFQSGRHTFCIENAKEIHLDHIPGYTNVEISHLYWPLTTLRLRSQNIEELIQASTHILGIWREFSAPECDVLAYTNQTPHNTITPIARYRERYYEIDLVLRNNRTTTEHPLGLFHPHAQHHHIKKENIGLIEVMGLAVLPGRLLAEMQAIKEALFLANASHALSAPELLPHKAWVEQRLGSQEVNKTNIDAQINAAIGETFVQVLEDCGVFKQDAQGALGFGNFLAKL